MSPAVPDSRRTRRGDRSRGEIIKEGDMKPAFDDRESRCREDRIEGRTIILDSEGEFPKKLIILEAGHEREYQIVKTRKGGYLLN